MHLPSYDVRYVPRILGLAPSPFNYCRTKRKERPNETREATAGKALNGRSKRGFSKNNNNNKLSCLVTISLDFYFRLPRPYEQIKKESRLSRTNNRHAPPPILKHKPPQAVFRHRSRMIRRRSQRDCAASQCEKARPPSCDG